MSALMLSLWLQGAVAGQPVETVEECPWTPIETPSPTRPPDALAPDRGFVKCLVTAEIDADGKPAPKQVEECEEPFASAARSGVAVWRFDPCVLTDGRGVEGTIRVEIKFASSEFQLQGDERYSELMAMYTEGPKATEGCAASMRIVPDGTVSDLQSSDVAHCIGAAKPRTLKHHHLELKKPVTCKVEIDVTKQRPDTLNATVSGKGCDGDTGKYAIDVVSSFPWNSPIGGSEHYSVQVTLGPEK